MMINDTPRTELINTFGQIVGVEKAEDLVEDAAAEFEISGESVYSTEDVIDICNVIEGREEGYIAMLAADIKVQKQSERRFNTLLENIPDPTVVVTFEGHEPIIKTVNSSFEQVFGYGFEEVQGQSLPGTLRPDELHDSGSELDPQQLISDRVEREVRRQTRDGTVRNFLVRSMPITTMSGEIETAIIHTDITEQKRRQRELEQKNEQLERFASAVSHDLRNPLTVALGRLDVIRDAVEGDTEHVDVVDDALFRMKRLIDDILMLAKQGEAVGETKPVDVEKCTKRAWANIDSGGATIDIAGPGLPTVAADPHRLQEVFENLFSNAIEHGGDAVTVSVGKTAGGIYIADNGPGIPVDKREEVFEQGFTTADNGTGFGLSIVETIVEAHGWDVTVMESETGGAKFELLIPELEALAEGVEA